MLKKPEKVLIPACEYRDGSDFMWEEWEAYHNWVLHRILKGLKGVRPQHIAINMTIEQIKREIGYEDKA